MQAIETKFNGYRFRSRTEARYAVLWHALNLKYEYESQGWALPIGAYLPDFWLPVNRIYVETKGKQPEELQVELCQVLATESDCPVVLLVGQPAEDTQGLIFTPKPRWSYLPVILGEIGIHKAAIAPAIVSAREARFEFGETPQIVAA